MKTHEATGRAPVRGTLFALILAMTGCTQAPDLKVVQAERAKPVLRFDTFQSAASNGKVFVAGSSGGAIVTSGRAETWTRQQLPSPASIIALTQCPDGSFAGKPSQLPLFYHHNPVILREIRGNQMKSRTVQVIGWQEDMISCTC